MTPTMILGIAVIAVLAALLSLALVAAQTRAETRPMTAEEEAEYDLLADPVVQGIERALASKGHVLR
jgi:hypothetical protein